MYQRLPFSYFATWAARASGHPFTFALTIAIILAWGLSGPLFHFSW
jgi:low affinity Fe/Cu permease